MPDLADTLREIEEAIARMDYRLAGKLASEALNTLDNKQGE